MIQIQESGLVKFKTGFGVETRKIELETVQFKPSSVAYSQLQRLLASMNK